MSITRNRWTEQDDKNLIQFTAQGYKRKDIAKIMDRTEKSIATRLSLLKNHRGETTYKRRVSKKYNQNEIAYIVLNHNKFHYKEIAKNLGRSTGSVTGTISRLKQDGLITEPKSMVEPRQMELIAPQEKQEIKPPIQKVDDNLNQQINGLKLDNKWLASLCIINFIGVVIIAISAL